MESGNVSISGVGDDGIQTELSGTASTGVMPNHEDEDSGNFYMLDGVLTISNYEGKAITADGTITYNGGTQNFDTSDTKILAELGLEIIDIPVHGFQENIVLACIHGIKEFLYLVIS